MSLPVRSRPGSSRTVWVEIDEDELVEVRAAFEDRVESLLARLDRVRRLADESESVALSISRINAVADRIPDAEAMTRRYP